MEKSQCLDRVPTSLTSYTTTIMHLVGCEPSTWTSQSWIQLLNRSCIFSPALADIQHFSAKEIQAMPQFLLYCLVCGQ